MDEDKPMMTELSYEPLDADTAPDEYEILTVYELTPADITETPPLTAKLFMSPEFTNTEGADADSGKTRHYVVVLEYPDVLENTVIQMKDCPTVHGSRMFRKFVQNTADEKGYTMEREDIEDYL